MNFQKIGYGKKMVTRTKKQGILLNLDPAQIRRMADLDLKAIFVFPNDFKRVRAAHDFIVYGCVEEANKND